MNKLLCYRSLYANNVFETNAAFPPMSDISRLVNNIIPCDLKNEKLYHSMIDLASKVVRIRDTHNWYETINTNINGYILYYEIN